MLYRHTKGRGTESTGIVKQNVLGWIYRGLHYGDILVSGLLSLQSLKKRPDNICARRTLTDYNVGPNDRRLKYRIP